MGGRRFPSSEEAKTEMKELTGEFSRNHGYTISVLVFASSSTDWRETVSSVLDACDRRFRRNAPAVRNLSRVSFRVGNFVKN